MSLTGGPARSPLSHPHSIVLPPARSPLSLPAAGPILTATAASGRRPRAPHLYYRRSIRPPLYRHRCLLQVTQARLPPPPCRLPPSSAAASALARPRATSPFGCSPSSRYGEHPPLLSLLWLLAIYSSSSILSLASKVFVKIPQRKILGLASVIKNSD